MQKKNNNENTQRTWYPPPPPAAPLPLRRWHGRRRLPRGLCIHSHSRWTQKPLWWRSYGAQRPLRLGNSKRLGVCWTRAESLTWGCYFCNTLLCRRVFVKTFPISCCALILEVSRGLFCHFLCAVRGTRVLPRDLLSCSRISGTLVFLWTF